MPPEGVILMKTSNPKSKFNTFKGVVEEILKEGSYYRIKGLNRGAEPALHKAGGRVRLSTERGR